MAKADTPGHESRFGHGLVAGQTYTDKHGRECIVNCFLRKVPAVRRFYYVEDPDGDCVDVRFVGVTPEINLTVSTRRKKTGKFITCAAFAKSVATPPVGSGK